MSMAICLAILAGIVSVVAARYLPRLTRSGSSPWFGITAWLSALVGVVATAVASIGSAAVSLISEATRHGFSIWVCFAALGDVAMGSEGWVAQLAFGTIAIGSVAAALVSAVRTGRCIARSLQRTRDHAESARIIGRRISGLDAFVLDSPELAAYCVGGRKATVVVTSGAVAALEPHQLDAVIAHERAHITQHHHLILTIVRGLASGLPRPRIFLVAAAELAHLLEMAADDTAARSHGSANILGALITLAGVPKMPRGALAASSANIGERALRLANPADSRRVLRTRMTLGVITGALTTLPAFALAGSIQAAACSLVGMA